jgi:hypothetical protein
MQMLSVAGNLDWGGWLTGIIGAIISGGAGAVASGISTNLVDPDHFNVHGGLHNLLAVIGTTFAVAAIISLAKFLQTHPVPTAKTS